MRRIIVILIALLSILYGNAQEIKTKAAYQYGYIVNMDEKGNAVDELDCGGIILIAETGRQEYVSVTIGDQEAYTGIVHSKKQERVDTKTWITVYLVIQEFNQHKIPLQIFEVYDLDQSANIPNHFIVSVCSAMTGEIIQSQLFHKISRVR